MFDQLFQMIQQSGQSTVIDNDQVPNEHNEDVLKEAHNAVVSGLGNVKDTDQVNGLFESVQSGSAQSNPAVQQISNNFMGSIMDKFGISSGAAASIAAALIPMVISKVVGRNNQQGSPGGFDLGGLLSGLTGGNTERTSTTESGGLGGTINNAGRKLGLDKDGDGDVDLRDLSKMF